MRRRLMLARAIVNDPDLNFMYEPTTGLDRQARHMIWERLETLVSQGKTILLTTHFMDEAERLCDRLAVIDHDKLIAGCQQIPILRFGYSGCSVVFGDWSEYAYRAGCAHIAHHRHDLFLDGAGSQCPGARI